MKKQLKETLWFSDLRLALRTPTWKSLGLSLFLVSAYYFLLYYAVEQHFDFDFHIPGFVIYSLGYVIAILFYFRLNNSYYRWFDGVKTLSVMRGHAESFIIKVRSYLGSDNKEDLQFLTVMAKNQYRALRDLVRGFQNPKNLLEPYPGYPGMKGAAHLATRINSLIQEKINDLYRKEQITRVQFLDLNRIVERNSEHVSTCEALQDTPPPKTYIIHLRGFLCAYAAMIPFGFLHDIEVWILLFLIIFFYFYTGLEIISDEIEDPFGFDENDIPVQHLTQLLEKRIDDLAIHPPKAIT